MRKLKSMLFLIVILSFVSIFQGPANAGTVVGNGGEPLLHFLEATRFALVETLRDIHATPALTASFCSSETNLSSEQRQFCHDYLFEIMDQMIQLNTEPHAVSFVLREEPLMVIGPDGQPMPVAARTELGTSGPIEFHLDSIKLMAPKNLLQLVAHEFQHKTIYRGASPTDNDALGPFQNGRLLIDSVASAISAIAVENGRIGREFSIRDSFDCVVKSGELQMGQRASTDRWFFDTSLTNYRFSLSEQPSDPVIWASETITSKIVFALEVVDQHHCANLEDKSLRHSKVTLQRVFDDPHKPPVLLSEQTIEGLNPLCEQTQPVFRADFQMIHFECRYYGSTAR